MEDLLRVIEKVKERAEKFKDILSHNEFATRYALIDPVLRTLGWDTEDLSKIVPELSTEQGTPDYALYSNGEPVAMLEAKSLGTNLEKYVDIGFRYCWKNRVEFFIITNGDRWILYDMKQMGGEKIFDVSILSDPAGIVARNLMALWYPAAPELKPMPEMMMEIGVGEKPPTKGERTFADLLKEDLKFKTPPSQIILPNGEVIKDLRMWIDLLRALVARLDKRNIPLPYPGSKVRYVVNFEPVHPTGLKFYSPEKINDFWLEKDWNSNQKVKISAHILELLGFRPDEVIIKD